MRNINILITSVGGDIGSNMVRILREQNIFKCSISGTDIKDYIFCKKDLDTFHKVPKVSDTNYTESIINILQHDKIDLIIPSSEYDIVYLNTNRDLFENLNVKLLINKAEIIHSFLDKFKTFGILKTLDISSPETYMLSEYKNELNFPLILKAYKSTVSKDIHTIKNQDEFNKLLPSINNKNEYIIQKYIGSSEQEYTTAVYKHNESIHVITFRRTLDGDKTGYAEICHSEKLELYSRLIADNFLLNGSINIQSRMYNDDYYIFEINPRISSTVYIRNYFNFPDLIWWICDLCKIPHDNNAPDIEKRGIAVLGYTYMFYDNKTHDIEGGKEKWIH